MNAVRKSLKICCFLLLAVTVFGQNVKKIIFGKIPAEDLSMKVYDQDSTADVVILDHVGEMKFNIVNRTEAFLNVHTRKKILTEAGINSGVEIIRYIRIGGYEEIQSVKAQVIQPDGTIVKVEKSNIVDEKYSDYYGQLKIAFPGLQVGSIMELKYEIKGGSFYFPRVWHFQSIYPTRYAALEVDAPGELEYGATITGNENIKQEGKVYYGRNLPAIREEAYMTIPQDYFTKLNLQIKSYKNAYGKYVPVLENWNQVAYSLYNDSDFGKLMYGDNWGNPFWDDLKSKLNAGSLKDYDKAKLIYDHIVNHFEWDKNYYIYPDKNIGQLYEDKLGNTADINGLIIHLMRKAGLNAHPVMTSPRSEGWFNPHIPLAINLRTILGSVYLDGKLVFFNGAHKFGNFGILADDDFNRSGLLIKEEMGEVIELPAQQNTSNHKFEISFTDKWNMKVEATNKYANLGIQAESELHQKGELEKTWEKRLAGLQELEITNFRANKTEKSYDVSFTATYGEEQEESPDIIYFNPNIYSKFSKNQLISLSRTAAVDFGNGYAETILTTIEIPENYKVETLPDNLNVSTYEKEVSFNINYSQVGNKISIIKKTVIAQPYILSEHYDSLRNLFSQIEAKHNDMLVLKSKKQP